MLTISMFSANSDNNWRQAPQGVTGSLESATITIRRNERAPVATAAKIALRLLGSWSRAHEPVSGLYGRRFLGKPSFSFKTYIIIFIYNIYFVNIFTYTTRGLA